MISLSLQGKNHASGSWATIEIISKQSRLRLFNASMSDETPITILELQ